MEEGVFIAGYEFIKGMLKILKSMKSCRWSTCMALRDCIDYWREYLEGEATIIDKDGSVIDVVDYDASFLTTDDKIKVFDKLTKTWELTKDATLAEIEVFGNVVDGCGVVFHPVNDKDTDFWLWKEECDSSIYSIDMEAAMVARRIAVHDKSYDRVELGEMRFARLSVLIFAKALLNVAQDYFSRKDNESSPEEVKSLLCDLAEAISLISERIRAYLGQYPDDAVDIDEMMDGTLGVICHYSYDSDGYLSSGEDNNGDDDDNDDDGSSE